MPRVAPSRRARVWRRALARSSRPAAAFSDSADSGAALSRPGTSSISSGSSTTAAMKKNSFLTSGPAIAMVRAFAGSQPASDSSW